MIKDIESGLINCVITKDFFPEHNVRYIAVNDGVDTLNKSAMDITPFSKMNGYYNSDKEDYIRTKLIESLFKFRLDR
jgi:site-specific DNA recombinase